MLTLKQLQDLLTLNSKLTVEALRTNASTQRLHELAIHRQVVKDCMLELLLTQNAQFSAKKVS